MNIFLGRPTQEIMNRDNLGESYFHPQRRNAIGILALELKQV